MLQKGRLFFSMIFTLLFFSACQKEPSFGYQDYKTLGTSAHDLLSPSVYTSLLVEISYMPGFEPDASSITNLSVFLNSYCNKPAGIRIFLQPIPTSGKVNLTLNDVVAIEKKYRTVFTSGNLFTVHFLITDGYYNSSTTFGTSYWNSSSCIFGQAIYDNAGGIGQVTRPNLVSTILMHEFGHLLGLVNQGSPMQAAHVDAANGAHCTNSNCLMHYAIETSTAGGNGAIPSLDGNCIADLKANGGK